jgi:peroxiredoxin
MSIRRAFGIFLLAAVTVCLAYVLGSQAGSLMVSKKERNSMHAREIQTKEILAHMQTIDVGDTLPDHTFVDLDMDSLRLSDVVCDRSVITVFDYHCSTCFAEIEEMNRAARDSVDFKYFTLVSSTNPLYLVELQEVHNIQCRIIYDKNRRYLDGLNISIYPFNIIVNKDMEIQRIVAGILTQEELEEIIDFNKRIQI